MSSHNLQRAQLLFSSHKPVVRLLYRSLLNHAKIFDLNPTLKAIWKRPEELRETNDSRLFYVPSKSFVEEVRRRFREEIPLTSYDFNKSQDLGFTSLRSLHSIQKYYFDKLTDIEETSLGETEEKKSQQHKNISLLIPQTPEISLEQSTSSSSSSETTSPLDEKQTNWAIPEPSSIIRPGLYLVAHPMMTGYFRNSIILICSHDKQGTTGLILNKKIHPILLRSLMSRLLQKGKSFNRKKIAPLIKQGGPVKQNWLSALHTNKDLKNSLEVSQNIYLNINLKLMSSEFVKETSSPSNFRFFFGYCFWTPGQLETEIRNGFWFPASMSSNFIFSSIKKKYKPFNVWRDTLRSLGGEYSAFVDVPDLFWKQHIKKLENEEAEQEEEIEEFEID